MIINIKSKSTIRHKTPNPRVFTTLVISAMILFGSFPLQVFGEPLSSNFSSSQAVQPEILAESGILIDARTGEILYTKNQDYQLEPASTTKIMTCLLAIENLDLKKSIVIDNETPFTEGSRVYLLEDEVLSVEQLLYALMLESANDAAIALGKEVSGDLDSFYALMNKRAKEIGATDTNFISANGLHVEGHLTTVRDLAIIAKECMKNETFRKLASTYRYVVPATNKQPERYFYNTNRLLYDEKIKVPVNGVMQISKYPGALGIKTGYTKEAGGCLVAAAERDGTELIAVVLKSTDKGRFGDCIALLDYGFANYKSYLALSKDRPFDPLKVKRGKEETLAVGLEEDFFITLPKDSPTDIITTEANIDQEIKAPVAKGQQVGSVSILKAGKVIEEIPILATKEVAKGHILTVFGLSHKKAVWTGRIIIIILSLLLLIFISCALYLFTLLQKQERRKKLREKRAMELAIKRQTEQSRYSGRHT